MKTEFTCSRCGVACATDRDLTGRRVRCLSCGFVQRIPDASVTPPVAAGSYELAPAPAPAHLSRPVPAEPSYFPARNRRNQRINRDSRWLNHLRPWVFETSQVQGIGTCLIVLSAADLLMTFVLLRKKPVLFRVEPHCALVLCAVEHDRDGFLQVFHDRRRHPAERDHRAESPGLGALRPLDWLCWCGVRGFHGRPALHDGRGTDGTSSSTEDEERNLGSVTSGFEISDFRFGAFRGSCGIMSRGID